MNPAGWRLARSVPTTSQLLTLGLLSAAGRQTKPQLIDIYEALVVDGDPLQDEPLVELVAAVIYAQAACGHHPVEWGDLIEGTRDWYRKQARAVLALFRGERA